MCRPDYSFQAHKDVMQSLSQARAMRSALVNRLYCADVFCECGCAVYINDAEMVSFLVFTGRLAEKYMELLGSIELDGTAHFPHHRSVPGKVRGDLVLLTRPRQRLRSSTSTYSSWRRAGAQLSIPSGHFPAFDRKVLVFCECNEGFLQVSSGLLE